MSKILNQINDLALANIAAQTGLTLKKSALSQTKNPMK